MQYFFWNKDINLLSADIIVHRETERKCFFLHLCFYGGLSMFSKLDICTAHLVLEEENNPFRRYSSENLLWKRQLYMIHTSSWFTTGTAMTVVKRKLWFNTVVPNQMTTLIVLPINYFALYNFNVQGGDTLGGNPVRCTVGTVLAPHQMERTNTSRSDY